MGVVIRPLEPGHWEEVRLIYLEGIATGAATFERVAPSWERWNSSHLPFARLVALDEERVENVKGWAALSLVSARPAYAGVAEVSVYVRETARGHGIGKNLLERLVRESENNGIWTLQASVFPENQGSIRLHKTCGFRQVGIRHRVGNLNGAWRDTVLLERRSKRVGIE
jgi:L-amino acid N-acyltransferase YncA